MTAIKQRIIRTILVVALLAIIFMYETVQVFAAEQLRISNIMFTSAGRTITLSDTADGEFSKINPSALNKLNIKFDSVVPMFVTVLISEVNEPVSDPLSVDNIIYTAMKSTKNGAVEFEFLLRPRSKDGIYAMYIGGTNSLCKVGYFGIKSKTLPFSIAEGQSFLYDEYKNGIELRLDVKDVQQFKKWAAELEETTVTLQRDDKVATVCGEKLDVNTDTGIVCIPASEYCEIIPGFNEAKESSFFETNLSIKTLGWWSGNTFEGEKNSTIGLMLPDFSLDGFRNGVNFEFVMYSDTAVSGVVPFVVVYDNNRYVGLAMGEVQNLNPKQSKVVQVHFQSDDIEPSNNLHLKVMLWSGETITPLTSAVNLCLPK